MPHLLPLEHRIGGNRDITNPRPPEVKKIAFPFHARSFVKLGKTKYIHVIVGVVIPLVPVISLTANFASEVHIDMNLQAANTTHKRALV